VVLFIKRIEITMKKTSILLLINIISIQSIFCQALVQSIEDAYNSLDSIHYIESIIDMFREQVSKEIHEINDVMLEIRGIDYNKLDTIQKQHMIDSIMGKNNYSKALIDDRTNWFATKIRDKSTNYVLNLNIKTYSNNQVCVMPDTSSLPFNLFYFDKRSNVKFFVLLDNGQISHYDTNYRTFSNPIGRNNRKVFRKIRRENPKFLLFSYDLEQMNTVLYLLYDKIYVYRISEMEVYEFNDYIKKFVLENIGHTPDSTNTFIE